jgi:hypothetical protein
VVDVVAIALKDSVGAPDIRESDDGLEHPGEGGVRLP